MAQLSSNKRAFKIEISVPIYSYSIVSGQHKTTTH